MRLSRNYTEEDKLTIGSCTDIVFGVFHKGMGGMSTVPALKPGREEQRGSSVNSLREGDL